MVEKYSANKRKLSAIKHFFANPNFFKSVEKRVLFWRFLTAKFPDIFHTLGGGGPGGAKKC